MQGKLFFDDDAGVVHIEKGFDENEVGVFIAGAGEETTGEVMEP